MYMYMCIYTYIYIYMCVCVCVCACLCVCVCVCVCVCKQSLARLNEYLVEEKEALQTSREREESEFASERSAQEQQLQEARRLKVQLGERVRELGERVRELENERLMQQQRLLQEGKLVTQERENGRMLLLQREQQLQVLQEEREALLLDKARMQA